MNTKRTNPINIISLFLAITLLSSNVLSAPSGLYHQLSPPQASQFISVQLSFDDKTQKKIEEFLLEDKQIGRLGPDKIEDSVLAWIQKIAREQYGADTGQKKKVLQGLVATIREGKKNALSGNTLQELFAKAQKAEEANTQNPETLLGKNLGDLDKPIYSLSRYGGICFLLADVELFVVGDTHGDSYSVQIIINKFVVTYQQARRENKRTPYIVFLGDYNNNGLDSIGTLEKVIELKNTYRENVVLLNGNHEFGETYSTVVKEFFGTHWGNASRKPYHNKGPPKEKHYGHIRFELIKKYGVAKGEEIHSAFTKWGRSLPFVCIVPGKRLMMSHSLGLPKDKKSITLKEIAEAKSDKEDIDAVNTKYGYEAWKAMKATIHAAMVNNRKIDENLLDVFKTLGITHHIVGHSHYRSGDVDTKTESLITICSSNMASPTAGHYMYQEFVVGALEDTGKKKDGKPVNGARFSENRGGKSSSCYLQIDLKSPGTIRFAKAKKPVRSIVLRINGAMSKVIGFSRKIIQTTASAY